MPKDLRGKIDDIYERLGWHVMRRVLGGACGITAISREAFKEKFVEQAIVDSDIHQLVDDCWENLVIAGKRISEIYNYEEDENSLNAIVESLESAKLSKSIFNQHFPTAVNPDALSQLDGQLYLCNIEEIETHGSELLLATICRKAYYTAQTELQDELLSDEGRDRIKNGAQLICKERKATQCFHTLIVDKKRKLLILSADMSVLPKPEAVKELHILKKYAGSLKGSSTGPALNLFSAIEPLYTKHCGRITGVDFLTADGNPSHLAANGSNDRCLKTDSYHRAGESATGVLTKYKLKKVWDLIVNEDISIPVSLELHGRSKDVYTGGPVSLALIENCPTIEEKVYAINKLLEVLQPADT